MTKELTNKAIAETVLEIMSIKGMVSAHIEIDYKTSTEIVNLPRIVATLELVGNFYEMAGGEK